MTPTELFDHRLAALLRFPDIEEMKRSMSQRSYLGWQKYWAEEPWGPYRDNLHAAMIAREVRRSLTGTTIELDKFMVVNPELRRAEATTNMLNTLKVVSIKRARPK